MKFHEHPRLPMGFRCASRLAGLKPQGKDLALFVSDTNASAAAIFTRSHFAGAPVVLGRETVPAGGSVLRAIVVNSRVSNVATGEDGLKNARRMATAAARELGVARHHVLVSSTGVIGVPLPIDLIERGLVGMGSELQDNPLVGVEGMMTTDSYPKALSGSIGDVTITWVAKGSGMIEPNMATMLVYILTDAAVQSRVLDQMLRDAAHVSFNMLSIDTDTSTSDTCAILANGLAGAMDPAQFSAALREGCVRMTEMLARDGEGATRLLRVTVRGARDERESRVVAKSLVNSPLIKTMVHGADPNVGRILMAIGKCTDCTVDPAATSARINGFEVVHAGVRVDFDDATVRATLSTATVDIVVDLGVGSATATAYGCDFSPGYITENAAYYSS
jgi:glutamate N-acetyltransferase/amino-acid N-acetyltransferase